MDETQAVRIEQEAYDALVALAEANGQKLQWLVSRAVEEYVQRAEAN